jgi:hypothetical protein
MIIQQILPKVFEREQMKCVGLNVGECGLNYCYKQMIVKPRDTK